MRRLTFGILLLMLLSSCSVARYAQGPGNHEIESIPGCKGTIQAVEYPSSETDLDHRRMIVYLPEGYASDTLRRYPVLYLLHGARGNEKTWSDSAQVLHRLDTLWTKHLAQPFILVMPNMNNYFGEKDYRNGRCLNAMQAFWLLDGEAERHFMHDVVARVDSLYRTIPEKSGRAIAGMSNGALQTIYLSANAPQVFDYIGLFSPYTYPTFAALGHLDVYGGLWKKLDVQFSQSPALYSIYIGKADFFYPHICLFEKSLTRRGYSHQFLPAEGGHEWYNWAAFFTHFCQHIFLHNPDSSQP